MAASAAAVLVGIINPQIGLVAIMRRRRVADRRPGRWRVSPPRNRTQDKALVRMHHDMPAVVMHRGGVGGGAESDQSAQGQNGSHRNVSNQAAMNKLAGAEAAPSQSVAASRVFKWRHWARCFGACGVRAAQLLIRTIGEEARKRCHRGPVLTSCVLRGIFASLVPAATALGT